MSAERLTRPSGPLWRWLLGGVGLAALLAVLVVGGRWWMRKPGPDLAALQANNRGIGHMEQFNYPEAARAFAEVVRRAPDWTPGRINLGIALLNENTPEALERAKEIFRAVLGQEPDNPYAHFCLGIMLMYQKDTQQAVGHFKAVLQKDPEDPYAWYWLGHIETPGSDEQTACYRQAVQRNPNLLGAVYGLAMNLRLSDPAKARAFLEESEALRQADWATLAEVKYGAMGRYAEVIGTRSVPPPVRTGPLPLFERRAGWTVRLAEGARWAKAADFGQGEVAEVRARVRARFGGTVVVLDYNRDGRPDLFLAGAVVEKGRVRDLLLRNDGGGGFVDVTAEAGLAGPRPTLGCCAADVDNDGFPDLFLTGVGEQRLFRNTGAGAFKDVTAEAKLDELKAVCPGATFVDLDQDSDLDLVAAEYAATPADALKRLKGEAAGSGGGLAVYLQVGSAPPVRGNEKAPPLDCRFRRAKDVAALRGEAGPAVGVVATDVDGDRDVDLLALRDRAIPALVLNDRLLHFRRQGLAEKVAPASAWNGGLVLDVDHDGRSDVLLVAAGQPPRLLLNRAEPGRKEPGESFEVHVPRSPSLLQAVTADVDLDGWADVVGLSERRVPVLLHNEGGRLVVYPDALGRAQDFSSDLIALTVCDMNGDGFPDLVAWSESRGLELYESRGNGNRGLRLEAVGRNAIDKQGNRIRCNADGVGAWVMAQAGDLWTGQENTTLSAGLGQSRQPLLLGLGRFPKADVVRLRWPDGTWQAELDQHAGALVRIEESNRKPTSCPILFTWNGQRYVFVTDFLGAGSMGELEPNGTCRPPRPEESVKIEAEQLVPRDGQYVLKVAEPMDEVTYLDRVQLVAIDHPADVRVYPDERFATAGPPPSQELIAFREEVFPVRALDHRGRDVTQTLRAWDRNTVDGFARRAWVGFAEEHAVELDFGDRLAKYRPGERLFLCLAGWTDYPYPQSIWAAHQAGVAMRPPVLERQDAAGRWQAIAEAGFPAGLPRMMLLDVTGKLAGPRCRLRLRTNLHVYWDQVFVAARCAAVAATDRRDLAGGARATCLEVSAAELTPCGIMQEFSPDGRAPTVYDHDRYEAVPVNRLAGRMTRYGDVTELLRDRDDRFVIFGPGDEVALRFDARALPPLPPGWKRSFVLRTRGYCKDAGPFTATGSTVEPLPFAAMRGYPYDAEQHYPRDPLHLDYLRRFNTREVRPDGFPAKTRR